MKTVPNSKSALIFDVDQILVVSKRKETIIRKFTN